MSDSVLQPFQKKSLLVVSPNQNYFRLILKALRSQAEVDILWADETIRGLAELFLQRPKGLIVMFETNHESLDFVQLVRNNPHFKALPVVVIFTEPLKWRQKWRYRRYRVWPLGTPIPTERLQSQAQAMLGQTEPVGR